MAEELKFTAEEAQELIRSRYPSLFPDYYREGEMEYLRHIDALNKGDSAPSMFAELPARYEALQKKIPAAIDYLKAEMAGTGSEMDHRATDSEHTTQWIIEHNVQERKVEKQRKWQAFRTTHDKLIYSDAGHHDTLASLFIKAQRVQHMLEERREGREHSVCIGGTMTERELAADVFATYLAEANVQEPENPHRSAASRVRS